jgi:sugar phosphate isomerase/epimerase
MMTTGRTTLAEIALSNGSQPVGSFRDRVAAAAAAGFGGMGLSFWVFRELRAAGVAADELRQLLDDHGLRVDELEVILGLDAADPVDAEARRWGPDWLPIDVPYADDAVVRDLFEMADTFQAHHVVAVGSWRGTPDVDRAAECFGRLCDQAAPHNVQVALEFVPGTSIPNLATGLAVVLAADRLNGGLCVDTWHLRLDGDDLALLDAVPVEKITVLQLADGPAALIGSFAGPDGYFRATMSERLVPGAGDFELASIIGQLRSRGYQGPVSVEILSSALAQLSVDEATESIAIATEAVLDAAVQAL